MKKILITAVWATFVFATGCSVAGPAAASKSSAGEAEAITARQITDMLSERLYKVDVTRAWPMGGRAFSLNYPYYISVIGNRVESFLPYFGRAYVIPYGGGEGLRFEAPITDYAETVKKRGQKVITFRARTGEDSYDFTLTVFPLGECSLVITPTQKQTISFSGAIDLSPEFEAVRRGE